MAYAAYHVRIVSPESPLFEGEADALTVAAHDGEVGILPGHAAEMTLLGTGIVAVRAAGGRGEAQRFAIRGGFLQVLGATATLLVTAAVRAEDVDAARVGAELAAVREGLLHPASDEEFSRLLDERAWAEARLALTVPVRR